MFNKILTGLGFSAATALPTDPPPKVKSKRQALPSYLKSAKPQQTPIPLTDRRLATSDQTTSIRAGSSTSKVLREMGYSSPEFSSAIFQYLRVGIPNRYTAVAQKPTGEFDVQATQALQQIIARFDVLPDYTQGFNGAASLRSCSESLAKEMLFEGAMCAELVLDKALLPARIQPISVSGLKMQPDKDGYLVPVQDIGGQKTVLDSPAIFYTALDQSLLDPYASSPMESSIKAVIFSESFINDIQRVMQRAIHPRLTVTIDEEKFRTSTPQDVLNDPEKMAVYQNKVISDIQDMVNGLRPEEALVYFDMIGIDLMNNGNASLANEYTFISETVGAKLASGAKTMPAVLGMNSGSQNVASTESMLFVKAAAGAVTLKLNEFYSRLFTLALRLMGYDVIAKFEYDSIDLRPEAELESFRAVKQSRVLELLSIGMLTDEEAALQLTGHLPPAGFVTLSGTFFKAGSTDPNAVDPNANPDTSSNSGSAANKDIKAGSAGVKSGNTKKQDSKKPAK